jgi:hypothetical protein
MLKVQGFKTFFVLCTFELELPLVTQGPLPWLLPGVAVGPAKDWIGARTPLTIAAIVNIANKFLRIWLKLSRSSSG